MPAVPVQEFFNRGIVTARDATLLQPGELQRADDCVYRMRDPAIHRAPGRTLFGQPSGGTGAVKGLGHLTFDGHTDQLLEYIGTNFYTGDFTGLTGSSTILTGPGQVSCTINNSATINAASGTPFGSMLAGAHVSGTGVPVGTYVLTVSSSSQLILTAATTGGSQTVTLTFDMGIPVALPDAGTEILDFVQWDSVYYTIQASGAVQRVWWRSRGNVNSTALNEVLIGRAAGLDPVDTFLDGSGSLSGPSIVSGTWSASLGNGVYWFLITEIADPGTPDEIEGAYVANNGKPRAVTIADFTTQCVKITFPAQKNDGSTGRLSTHWGIYMCPKQTDTDTVPSLALFHRVATTPIPGTTSITLGDSNVRQYYFSPSTVVAGPSGLPSLAFASNMISAGGTASAADNKFAVGISGNGNGALSESKLGGYQFSTSGAFAAAVTGISISVLGHSDGSGSAKAGYYVYAMTAGGKKSSTIVDYVGTTLHENTYGSEFDTLGANWVSGDFANGTFFIVIGKSGTNSLQTLYVDTVRVSVYYGGTTIATGLTTGKPYRVVTYRSQIGTTVSDPSDLPPPAASTGDIFQGQMVLNDLSDVAMIRYSLPGFPESFPKPYFLKFQSKRKDQVTCIRTLGQVLVVGLRDTIKRVNYLPTEIDTDFQEGIAHEDLATDHGIVGPLAAARFDLNGRGIVMAYISYNGPYLTDGITTRPLNQDLDWPNTVNLTNLGSCILRVYPKERWLVLYYNPAGAVHSQNSRALLFCYDQGFLKPDGTLSAIGPLTISARSAAEANLGGVPYLLTGHQTNGNVYVEDQGTAQASGYTVAASNGSYVAAPIAPLIRTRLFYPGGMERVAREERVYVRSTIKGTTITATANTTNNSSTATSAAAFGSVLVGMRVIGNGIKPGTIVLAVTDSSHITLSQAAQATATGVTLSFDTGTVSLAIRGEEIGDSGTSQKDVSYVSTANSTLLLAHLDNMTEALELQIEKLRMPDSSVVDLGVGMRLHYFAYILADAGMETNRASN